MEACTLTRHGDASLASLHPDTAFPRSVDTFPSSGLCSHPPSPDRYAIWLLCTKTNTKVHPKGLNRVTV
eukprot:221064-Pyramimonas_sp.AAC.1